MTVIADAKTNAKRLDLNPPAEVARQRPVYQDIIALENRFGEDPDYPTDYEAKDEVQEIGSVTADDGTYTIEFELANGDTFTTGAINHDDNAAAIETAIDSAATSASVTDWTNGDISVSGGPVDTADVVLTFDGDSVSSANHTEVVIANSLTNGGPAADDPAVSTTTQGQAGRWAWALLRLLGVIAGTPPAQGTSAAVTGDTTPATNPYYPDQETIRVLANEAAVADGNDDVETEILTAAGL